MVAQLPSRSLDEDRPVLTSPAQLRRRALGTLGPAVVLLLGPSAAVAAVEAAPAAEVAPGCDGSDGLLVVTVTAGDAAAEVTVTVDGETVDVFEAAADETRSYPAQDGPHAVVVTTAAATLADATPLVDCVRERVELAVVPACEPSGGVGVTGLSADQVARTIGIDVGGTVTTLEVPPGASASTHVAVEEGVHTVTLTDGDEPPFVVDVEVACDASGPLVRDPDVDPTEAPVDDGTAVLGEQITAEDDVIPDAGAGTTALAVVALLLLLVGTAMVRHEPT